MFKIWKITEIYNWDLACLVQEVWELTLHKHKRTSLTVTNYNNNGSCASYPQPSGTRWIWLLHYTANETPTSRLACHVSRLPQLDISLFKEKQQHYFEQQTRSLGKGNGSHFWFLGFGIHLLKHFNPVLYNFNPRSGGMVFRCVFKKTMFCF